jgi:hypothetical protein
MHKQLTGGQILLYVFYIFFFLIKDDLNIAIYGIQEQSIVDLVFGMTLEKGHSTSQ